MSLEQRQKVALLFKQCQEELEQASRYYGIASTHVERGQIPRGCAHAFASQGLLRRVDALTSEASGIHAQQAVLNPPPTPSESE